MGNISISTVMVLTQLFDRYQEVIHKYNNNSGQTKTNKSVIARHHGHCWKKITKSRESREVQIMTLPSVKLQATKLDNLADMGSHTLLQTRNRALYVARPGVTPILSISCRKSKATSILPAFPATPINALKNTCPRGAF